MLDVTRRKMLLGAATLAIVGFDPARKAWATGPGPGVIAIPGLDGQLLTGSATRTAAADDYGHIVHRTPAAVLVPGSVNDIVKVVKFAAKHGLRVGPARGIGESHSTQGQAQVEAGLVIDMSALAQIHQISGHEAYVDAGVRWIDLLTETVPLGKSPPTLTDFIELSVGGTLSVGGIGGQAFHQGFQVDNVIELEVVTGRGQLVTCSRQHRPDLFDAVRAGLGQFGVIVRARLRLIDVPAKVRVYTATYTDLPTFLADQTRLIDQGGFDYVEGSATPAATGFTFGLEAAKYFDPSHPPDDASLTAGLSFVPGSLATNDVSYFDFANRLAPTVAFLKAIGAWGLPHPWLNLFVPEHEAASFIQAALDSTATADTGQGPILLYPFRRCELTAPFLKVPLSERVFILSLLRNAVPPIPDQINALVAANRALFDELRPLGGKRYPIDSVPMSQADWHAHYGLLWPAFALAKAAFDPDHILAPGQGIFLDPGGEKSPSIRVSRGRPMKRPAARRPTRTRQAPMTARVGSRVAHSAWVLLFALAASGCRAHEPQSLSAAPAVASSPPPEVPPPQPRLPPAPPEGVSNPFELDESQSASSYGVRFARASRSSRVDAQVRTYKSVRLVARFPTPPASRGAAGAAVDGIEGITALLVAPTGDTLAACFDRSRGSPVAGSLDKSAFFREELVLLDVASGKPTALGEMPCPRLMRGGLVSGSEAFSYQGKSLGKFDFVPAGFIGAPGGSLNPLDWHVNSNSVTAVSYQSMEMGSPYRKVLAPPVPSPPLTGQRTEVSSRLLLRGVGAQTMLARGPAWVATSKTLPSQLVFDDASFLFLFSPMQPPQVIQPGGAVETGTLMSSLQAIPLTPAYASAAFGGFGYFLVAHEVTTPSADPGAKIFAQAMSSFSPARFGGAWRTSLFSIDQHARQEPAREFGFAVRQPPIDATGGLVYLVGDSVVALQRGQKVWEREFRERAHGTALRDGTLALAHGKTVEMINRDSKTTQIIEIGEPGPIVLPPAIGADGVIWVATDKAVYEIK